MKRVRTCSVGFSFLLVLVFALGAGGAGAGEKEDGLDVYFRDADLMAPGAQRLAVYSSPDPGESEPLTRAYPGAPPQIPHSLEDMLPITTDSNECVECHHPDNVSGEEDLPIPDSHFQHPVLGPGGAGDAMVWQVVGYEKRDKLSGARFNCTTCHVPRAMNVRTPPSRFVREKREPAR